jgi:hypothetical protein
MLEAALWNRNPPLCITPPCVRQYHCLSCKEHFTCQTQCGGSLFECSSFVLDIDIGKNAQQSVQSHAINPIDQRLVIQLASVGILVKVVDHRMAPHNDPHAYTRQCARQQHILDCDPFARVVRQRRPKRLRLAHCPSAPQPLAHDSYIKQASECLRTIDTDCHLIVKCRVTK